MSIFRSSKTDRAYEIREERQWAEVAPYMRGIEDFAKRERRKNHDKQMESLPRVQDVVTLRVMPTGDGGFTVSLVDVDGLTCTFWVRDAQLPQVKPMIDGAHQGYRSNDVTFPVHLITSY